MEFNHYRESLLEMEDRMLEEKLDTFIDGFREDQKLMEAEKANFEDRNDLHPESYEPVTMEEWHEHYDALKEIFDTDIEVSPETYEPMKEGEMTDLWDNYFQKLNDIF